MAAKKDYTYSEANTRKELGYGSGPLSSMDLMRVKNSMLRQKQALESGRTPVMPSDVQARLDAASKINPTPNASGSGGPSALDRYTQQLQQMLTSGAYRKPYEDLQSQLQGLYTDAGGQINTAMNALKSSLQAQANPYAGFQAQNVQATPQLSELLASQGVSANPLQQLAAATQAQNAGQASAFNNLVSSLGTIYGANQAGQISDVAAQRADLQNQLEQSRLGFGAQLNEKAMGQQQNLMTMLLTALAKGGKAKKGRLF